MVTREAGSLHRTAMTQPGVYFRLDAPFVRIIGLFSNALEDPGVISSEGGRWPGVPDTQLAFLAAQLERIKREAYAGAVLIAVHHPPFVYAAPPGNGGVGSNRGGSTDMLRDIDTVCAAAGVYPHAVLSAHAHCYQRYTRHVTLGGKTLEGPSSCAAAADTISIHCCDPPVAAPPGCPKTARTPAIWKSIRRWASPG